MLVNLLKSSFVSLLDITEFYAFRKQLEQYVRHYLKHGVLSYPGLLRSELTVKYSTNCLNLNGKPIHEIVAYVKKK